MTDLEQRYRRLLLAYPRAYRAERGDEIIDTLLAATDSAATRPTLRESRALLLGGLLARLSGGPRSPRQIWYDGLHTYVVAMLVGGIPSAIAVALSDRVSMAGPGFTWLFVVSLAGSACAGGLVLARAFGWAAIGAMASALVGVVDRVRRDEPVPMDIVQTALFPLALLAAILALWRHREALPRPSLRQIAGPALLSILVMAAFFGLTAMFVPVALLLLWAMLDPAVTVALTLMAVVHSIALLTMPHGPGVLVTLAVALAFTGAAAAQLRRTARL